jgi:parallel beta-helix repeat protein
MKREHLVGLLILLLSAANANAGCIGNATGTDYGCGDTVIESCTFDGDLNCSTKYGLIIGADGIVIDGNGYAITTDARGDEEGIHNDGRDGVTIKNLRISGFCFGIYWRDADDGNIRDNSIDYHQGSGIWLFRSSRNNVTGNIIDYGDGGHGILLSSAANRNILKYNEISTVAGRGINIDGSNENELHDNRVCGNAYGDVVVESGSGNMGSNNTCEIAKGYSDADGGPCTHPCPLCEIQSAGSSKEEGKRGKPTCGCVSVRDPSTIFACGDTVTESCRFNCNLSCQSGHGLVIGADNIVIDGNGYTLDGITPGGCSGFGIQRSGIFNQGYDDVTIKDLEITNFCNGIYLRGDEITGDVVNNNTIDNCEIHHNGNDLEDTATHGIKMHYVYESTISNNLVHHNKGKGTSCENGGNGIFLNSGDYNVIANNTVYDNTKAGIFTRMKPRYNNVTDNRVMGNGQGGIVLRCKLSSFFTIENNIVTDNKGPGIYVGGPGNTLRYNTATNNKNGSTYGDDASIANGIRISREADNTTLIENNVTGNDDTDVYAKKGLTGIAGSNNTYQTSSNYEDYSRDSQVVRGKKVVGRTESFKSFESGTELPAVKVTPLMATLIVVALLVFAVFGYSRKK